MYIKRRVVALCFSSKIDTLPISFQPRKKRLTIGYIHMAKYKGKVKDGGERIPFTFV